MSVDVLPSPNDQNQLVGVLLDSSMKSTPRGAGPAVAFDTKAASGVETAETGRIRTRRRIANPIRRVFVFMVFLLTPRERRTVCDSNLA